MSNFAARNLSLGQVNALVKMLGGETAALAIIGGTLKFTLEAVRQPYNGSTFFQTRPGLWVDPYLERYVGLSGHTTRGTTMLLSELLVRNTSEADLFGLPDSVKHITTLQYAVDLGQIEAKIEAQWDGQEGGLLTNGYANIFPVVGRDGALHVFRIYRGDGRWYVHCSLFFAGCHWLAGGQVFSN